MTGRKLSITVIAHVFQNQIPFYPINVQSHLVHLIRAKFLIIFAKLSKDDSSVDEKPSKIQSDKQGG